jgi:NAD-dependent dihydropyrimidine dehydrogenase PreA subunit
MNRDTTGQVSGYERMVPAQSAGLYYNTLYIDERECIRCYACVEVCPTKAISPGNSRTPRVSRAAVVGFHGGAKLPGDDVAREVAEDRREITSPSR